MVHVMDTTADRKTEGIRAQDVGMTDMPRTGVMVMCCWSPKVSLQCQMASMALNFKQFMASTKFRKPGIEKEVHNFYYHKKKQKSSQLLII